MNSLTWQCKIVKGILMNKRDRNKKKVSRWRYFTALSKRNDSWNDLGYIDPNKWKIRGWKRRLKFLHNWGDWILTPDSAHWDSSSGYAYERYKVYPWYSFFKHREPPLWFFKGNH